MAFALFAAGHFAYVGLLALFAYVIGRRLTMSVPYSSLGERIAFSAGLGLACIAYLMLALGAARLLYPWLFVVLLVAAQVACYRTWRELYASARCALRGMSARRGALLLAAIVVGVAVAAPVWLLPLFPPTAYDANVYHLAIGKYYLAHHGIVLAEYLRYPLFPQTNELLLTLGLFYDDIAAHLMQFATMLVTTVALYAWGKRAFSRRAGLWAAALWLSNPLVLWLGASGMIDVGTTMFACLGTYAVFNWVTTKQRAWLVLAALFAGFAAASKYSAAFFAIALGLVVLYVTIRERRPRFAVLFGAMVLAVLSPWLVRGLIVVGNPVWPLLPNILGYNNLWAPADQQTLYADLRVKGIGNDFRALVLLPWNLVQYQGEFGNDPPVNTGLIWALPLTLFWAFRSRYVRGLLVLVAACVLVWFLSEGQVQRYLVPVLPALVLATAATLDRTLSGLRPLREVFSKRTTRRVAAWAVAALCLLPGLTYAGERVITRGPLPVTTQERDDYLARYLPNYPAHVWLNEQYGSDYRVYGLRDEDMAYFTDGTYMGGLLGPGRNSEVTGNLNSSRRLLEGLMLLHPDFFVVTSHREEFVLPVDDFFREHFELVYDNMGTRVYKVIP